jgi:ribose/xylose/arabinose/galactoside ABC-type transport system permease subunit
MKVLALAFAGLCAGLVGTLLAATLNSAAPDMAKDYLSRRSPPCCSA